MRLALVSLALLAGCAATPQQMAAQSNYTVCRETLTNSNGAVANEEARRRGLDCQPYYPAIMQQQANQNAAIQNYLRATQPAPQPMLLQPPVNCTSYRTGNTVQTQCN